MLIIHRLEFPLSAQTLKVKLISKTISAEAYGRSEASEHFHCRFGLNPAFRDGIIKRPLQVAGVDENGEVRIVEIVGHPFFIATLFLPQLSSTPSEPHPLVISFLKAATAFHHLRDKR